MKKNSVSIDSSCLIAMQANENLSDIFKVRVEKDWDAFCSEFAILESFYVLCRKFGKESAKEKIKALKESGVLQIEPFHILCEEAGLLKCQISIAIGDCFTIALAKKINGDAMFYNKEQELINAIKNKQFDVKIVFFEDLI